MERGDIRGLELGLQNVSSESFQETLRRLSPGYRNLENPYALEMEKKKAKPYGANTEDEAEE